MNFEQLLSNLKPTEATKTASESAPQQKLASALESTKTAAPATDAVETLMKTAAVLAENEKTAELVHAGQCGRAFASAALEVFAQVDAASKTAMYEQEKVAQDESEDLVKMAAEQGYEDTLVKVAAQQGYTDTMEKVAAEYNEGYNRAINDAVVGAANEFMKGAQEADFIVRSALAQQGR